MMDEERPGDDVGKNMSDEPANKDTGDSRDAAALESTIVSESIGQKPTLEDTSPAAPAGEVKTEELPATVVSATAAAEATIVSSPKETAAEDAAGDPGETTVTGAPMEEPRAIETEDDLTEEPLTGSGDNGDGQETASPTQLSRLLIGGIVLVVILIIVGLFLPPISLGERLGIGGGEESTQSEQAVPGEVGIPGEFVIMVGGSSKNVKVSAVPPADFQADEAWQNAAGSIPAGHILVSNVYEIEIKGDEPIAGTARVAIPSAAQPFQTLDLFSWSGEKWDFVPSQVGDESNELTSAEGPLPLAFALMQTSPPTDPAVGAEVLPTQSLPPAVLPYLSEVTAGTLTLTEGGVMLGEIVQVPSGGYKLLIRATNTGAFVDTVSLSGLLADVAAQEKNIADLVAQAQAASATGVNLDFQGVDAGQEAAFTGYVNNLSAALRSQGLVLVLTLETPVVDNGAWDTGGQNWQALGQIADAVYAQLPLEPTTYGDGGLAEEVTLWATRQVDRDKLSLLVSANAVDAVGEAHRELEGSAALTNFGELTFVSGSSEIEPGESVEVALSGTAGDLAWDPESLTYKYTYELSGQLHEVWLGSEALLNHRSRFGNRYNLRGLAVRGLGSLDAADGYAAALSSYLGSAEAPQPQSAAIVWAVEDDAGGVIASSSGEEMTYSWQAGDEPGKFLIRADFAQGDSIASLGALEIDVKAPPTPTPTPEPTKEPEVAPAATPAVVIQAGDVDPSDADVAAKTDANVRSGPGLAYGIVGGLRRGEKASLTGRNEDRSWLQVKLADGKEGWILAALVTVNSKVNVGSLAVIEVEPPSGAVASSGTSGSVPAPVAASGGFGGFELGGQTTGGVSAPDAMRRAGMNWIKVQAHHGQDHSGTIANAHAAGFKVLFSTIGEIGRVMDDGYQKEYAAYVGQLAGQGADAIEIWNEANIDREWPTNQIDPEAYARLLAYSFNAIKSSNPGTLVISGAPAPTGAEAAFPGRVMNDNNWLQGVVNAGGINYMDCVGAHYNEGTSSPTTYGGSAQGDNYYTRYYSGMVNTYWNITGGARPICFTELGFLSPEGYGSLPGNFGWAGGTTVAQQAQWLGEAVRLARGSGSVRLMIIFNVDFTQWLPTDPQAGYAIIRPGGGCPACDTMGAAMGGG